MVEQESIFQRFPWLALLGFFPPIYVIGMVVFAGAGILHIVKEGINDFYDLFALGAILIAPMWPIVVYRNLKEEKELRRLS